MGVEHEHGRPWYRGVSRGQWLVLTAALLGWMFDGFEMGIFPLVARPVLVDVLDLSAQDHQAKRTTAEAPRRAVDQQVGPWIGWITAAFLIGAALGGWVFGWLGDRLGRVRAMALSILTYAVFSGLCGLAQDTYQLMLLRFLAALGMGGEWSLGVALVMESWPARTRPTMAGLIGAAANVGFTLTVLLVMGLQAAGVSVDAGGWRWVLGACAFPAVLTVLLCAFVPESEKWRQAVREAPRARLAEIFTPQLCGRTLIGAALSGVALIGTWGSVQWIPPWVKGTTADQMMTNFAQMASGLGAVVGCLIGAKLGQFAGRRPTYFALCLGSLALCAYLFRWHLGLFPEMDWRFLAAVFLTGALTASSYGWLPLYLPELFPTRVRATAQGFAYNFGRVIAAGGAVSTGILMQDIFAGSYAQAGAAISLVYLAGMVLIWLAPETHGQPLPE
jgi:SHS family sialic acid transporter-like MFS transporter